MWGAVEVAWERDVINGDARSRAEFFSYATVSVVGLKGVDKLGKAGKVGNATSKADTTLPYNALKTDKLKETVKANVYATVQQKTEQAATFWQSNFSKEAINKTIEAAKNSAVMTKAKNTLESTNMKTAVAKTYEAVVKTPIAKTQAAWEKKKEQLLDMPLPNLGLSPVPLGPTVNMTVREGIEAAQNTVMQIVGNKDGGGERIKGIANPLLPTEGKVGTFKELAKQGTAFDNITPHHMPSAAKMKQAGVKRNDGVSMNMEQPHPGVGGRHRETYTYGLSGNKLEEYLNLSYRDTLTHDILDARRIYMKDGVYTPEIRAGLLNTIRKNRELYPELFNK